MTVTASPEWSVVLDALHAAIREDAESTSPAAAVPAAADWDRVLEMARTHRIGPLLYRGIRRLPQTPVPPRALEALKEMYVENAARNALLYRALEDLLGALHSAHIPVVVLKGAFLADWVYPDLALRPMSDIDLLVRAEDLDRAAAALDGIGCRIVHDSDARRNVRERHHHWIFRGAPPADGIPIEVHWDLHPSESRFRTDLDGLWRRAQPVQLAGASAFVLSPEDHLVYLISHAARHRFRQGLLPLCDLAFAVGSSRAPLDTAAFAARARESRCGAAASVLLELAVELLGAGVSEDVLAALRTESDETLDAALVRDRILEGRSPLHAAADLQLRWKGRSWRRRFASVRSVLATQILGPAGGGAEPAVARVPFVVGRYARWTWSLVANRRDVAAVAQRKADEARLDSWCGSGREDERPSI
jgi:hypothetical protein